MSRTCLSLRCLIRTLFAGAALTTRGMQHLGLLYALEPGLEVLYPDPDRLAAARLRYLEHVNTHPFMVPLLAGMLLSLESQVASGRLPSRHLDALKTTAATTLSALGDSFFNGSVLTFWALSATLLLLAGQLPLAAAWTALLFAVQLIFRVGTFFLGLRRGLLALEWVRRMDFINWSERLKMVNGVLLALFLWRILPHDIHIVADQALFWGLLGLGILALLLRLYVPRLVLAILLFCLLLTGDAAGLLPY